MLVTITNNPYTIYFQLHMQFAEHFLSTYFCRLNFRLLNIDTSTTASTKSTSASTDTTTVAVVVAINRLINIVVALVGVLTTLLRDTTG